VRLFDPRRPNAVLLAPGDKVRFEPVSRETFDRLEAAAEAGQLEIGAAGDCP
jgi:allophanate hydrolase subunit 1